MNNLKPSSRKPHSLDEANLRLPPYDSRLAKHRRGSNGELSYRWRLADIDQPWIGRRASEIPQSFLVQCDYNAVQAWELWMQCLKGGTRHLK